jgi:hypothetical protein
MPRHSSSSSSSSSSSRKLCPPNKFSFLSGCVSWGTSLTCFLVGALLIICVLLMTSSQLHNYEKEIKGDMITNKINNTVQMNHNKMKLSGNYYDTTKNNSNQSSNHNNTQNHTQRNGNSIVNRVDDMFESNDNQRNPHEGTGTPVSQRIKYDINVHNVNIRDDNPERPNVNHLSYLQYEADKNMERVINPLLPPERSYTNTYGVPINIPSRGPLQSFQQIGILYKENIVDTDKLPGNNNDSNILPLFGRPTFNGSRRWNYYTSSDKFQNFKIPITRNGRKCSDDNGCDEIMNGDMIEIPSYNGRFKVEIYDYDSPRYIPYVY